MLGTVLKARRALGVALLGAGALTLAAGSAHAADKELTVTITKIKALDKLDEFSSSDLFARVTIDGDVQSTAVIKGDNEIKPGWKITRKVKSGDHKVKVELLDKDVTQDDPIDINRVDKKRDLEFVVTSRCRVEGFSSTFKCGSSITRAGKEAKKADITFSVNVK